MSTIRVFLVDDHPIVCDGIRAILDQNIGIELVGEAHSGEEAFEQLPAASPDVVLLDMELPDMSGVDVADQLAEDMPEARVLALSSYDDPHYIDAVLGSGAAGYLLKDEVPKLIVDAIRGVARGEQGWLSRSVASHLSQTVQDAAAGPEALTKREKEVLRCVVDGKTNAEIGQALGISEKTVEKHLEHVFSKLGVGRPPFHLVGGQATEYTGFPVSPVGVHPLAAPPKVGTVRTSGSATGFRIPYWIPGSASRGGFESNRRMHHHPPGRRNLVAWLACGRPV